MCQYPSLTRPFSITKAESKKDVTKGAVTAAVKNTDTRRMLLKRVGASLNLRIIIAPISASEVLLTNQQKNHGGGNTRVQFH